MRIFIIIAILFSTQEILAQLSDTIYWNPIQKLKVTDFNFVNTDECDKQNADAVTHSNCDVKILWRNNIPYVKVRVFFIRSKSCAKDTSKLQILIGHEQIHFDIQELYGRKIRKEMKTLNQAKISTIKTYESLIRKIIKERDSVQSKYDLETFHGNNEESQKAWEDKIHKELKILENYSLDKLKY